jgi:hypothetical protein
MKGMPNLLNAYPADGPAAAGGRDRFKMDSIPKDLAKKVFGQETKQVQFFGQRSTFRQNKFASSERNQPTLVMGTTGPTDATDRFKVDSIPKETMKKVFGLETAQLGFIEPPSGFRQNKFASSEPNQPCPVFSKKGSGPSHGYDKFKVDSIPKETMKKMFGLETKHLGFVAPDSSFRFNKFASNDRNQPASSFGKPDAGPDPAVDRFKVHSIPKEIAAKTFGEATKHLGYIAPASSFRQGKFASTERNQPCATFSKPGDGPSHAYDKFKVDSIPKETMKSYWGLETGNVDFKAHKSTFRDDIGIGFIKAPKKTGSNNLEDEHWRQQLKQEDTALTRLQDQLAGRPDPCAAYDSTDSDDDPDDWSGPSITYIGGGARRRRPRPRARVDPVAARAKRLGTAQANFRAPASKQFAETLKKLDRTLHQNKKGGRGSGGGAAAVRGAAQRQMALQLLNKMARTVQFRGEQST